jgi:hypothetical protein
MLSRSQSREVTGSSPQLVGQVERSSIKEKPLLAFWYENALVMAFFASRMFFTLFTATRSM